MGREHAATGYTRGDARPLSTAPSFRRYPPRTEESGHVREYIADPGEHQFFELFVWLSGDTVVRFDCHYDIQRDERLLSWRASDERIHFMTVNPAKEKPIGMKKTQTLTETGRDELAGIRAAFAQRVAATAAGPHADDAGLSRLLAFIGERLPGA